MAHTVDIMNISQYMCKFAALREPSVYGGVFRFWNSRFNVLLVPVFSSTYTQIRVVKMHCVILNLSCATAVIALHTLH